MADIIKFDVQLPAFPSGDTASAELSIKRDHGTPDVRAVSKTDTLVTGLEGKRGEAVELKLSYANKAGTESHKAATAKATLASDLSPPSAGVLGVKVTGTR